MFNLGENSMKKTLVALAALAATGAFAQSSVTLYGVAEATVDMAYKKTTDVATATVTVLNATGAALAAPVPTLANVSTVNKSAFRVQDGNNQGVGTSRLGWRGTEDLGAGMKANFQMEMGLRLDDGCTTSETSTCAVGGSGNSGGNTFGRNAWVGASGGFGEVRLGRQVLGSFGVQANSWVAGSASGLYETGAGTAPLMGGVRFANAIKYLTPNIAGFSGTVSLRAPEGNSAATTTNAAGIISTITSKNKMGLDLSAEYANGPLYLGAGYNKVEAVTSTSNGLPGLAGSATAGSTPTKAFTLGASYNLGVVQPFFNYTKQTADTSASTIGFGAGSTNASTVDKAWSLGLKAPIGATTLMASYGKNKKTGSSTSLTAGALSGTGATEGTTKAFQIGAQYALSKRTLLEANYGYNKGESAVANGVVGALTTAITATGTTSKESALNVGLRHTF